MADKSEIASRLYGTKRAEGSNRAMSTEYAYGTAVEDSENGTVRVIPDGIVTGPDDGQAGIILDTSPSVEAGDRVLVMASGGMAKAPWVVAASGEGDRQDVRISEAELKAQQAKEAIEGAVEEVAEVKQEIAEFKSGADVDYAIYSYVDDEIGEFSQTVSATYLSKTDAQTTYATQSQLTQTAENITASVSQNYVTKTDAQTTYATKSELNLGLEGIELEVEQNYATKDEAATMGEGSGESVTVDSGARLRSLEVYGKSVQDGTPSPSAPVPIQVVSGANYFKGFADATSPVGTTVGVSFTMDMGVLYATGTATGTGYAWQANTTGYNRAPKVLLPAGTYTVSETTGLFGVRMGKGPSNSYYDVAPKGGSRTITLNEATELAFVPQVVSGTVYDNSVPVIMISSGSEARPYIPYGSLGLKVSGKNRFDYTVITNRTADYITTTRNSDGSITLSGTARNVRRWWRLSDNLSITLPAGTYTVTPSFMGLYDGSNYYSGTFTLDASTTFTNGYFVITSSMTMPMTVFPQIEAGSTATDYTPYIDSLTEIPLAGNVLASLPDGTKDVLTVDASGHCVITKRTGKVDLGTFDWSASTIGGNTVYSSAAAMSGAVLPASNTVALVGMSAPYTIVSRATLNSAQTNPALAVNTSGTIVAAPITTYNTAADFKTAMNGVLLYHKLATSTTVDLGYITMPELADGCTVQILASLTPTFGASWYTENGAALVDFATKSELQVTADGISSEVSTKVGSDEIISKINQSAETVKIQASNVEIDGTVTFNAIKSQTDAAYDAIGAAAAIEVGGTNLLIESQRAYDDGPRTNRGITIQYVGDGWWTISGTVSASTNGIISIYGHESDSTKYLTGAGMFAVSAEFDGWNAATTAGQIQVLCSSTKYLTAAAPMVVIDEVAAIKAIRIHIGTSANGAVINGKFRVKLERGNKATDWSPAPEDQTAYVDSLQVSSTNLVRNGDFSNGTAYWVRQTDVTFSTETDSTYGTVLKAVQAAAGSSTARVYPDTATSFTHATGETYSVSFYAKADAANTIKVDRGFSATEVYLNESISTSWKRYTGTLTSGGTGTISFSLGSAGTLYLAKVMLVRGEKYMDWSPDPRDVKGSMQAIYGTCSTAAGTAAKAVTCANFELFTGARIAVKFLEANTTAAPTLNVNGTGAKAIWYDNVVASASNPVLWSASTTTSPATTATLNFIYDGEHWVLDEKPPCYTASSGTTGRDTTASVAGALVVNGTTVTVRYTKANTSATAKRLTLGSTGLASMYFNNAAVSATNTLFWAANTELTFVRVGAGWHLSDNGLRKNITHIDDNGISIHAANNPTTNYIQLNASGMEVFKGGSSVAQFGETARIGQASGMHTEMTSSEFHILDGTSDAFSVKYETKNGYTHANLKLANLYNGASAYDIMSIAGSGNNAIGFYRPPVIAGGSRSESDGFTSLTRNYTSYGFTIEEAHYTANACSVTIPIRFTTTTNIDTGSNQILAKMDTGTSWPAPPTYQVRVPVFLAKNDWSSTGIGYATLTPDGDIYITSNGFAWGVAFGSITYTRNLADWS